MAAVKTAVWVVLIRVVTRLEEVSIFIFIGPGDAITTDRILAVVCAAVFLDIVAIVAGLRGTYDAVTANVFAADCSEAEEGASALVILGTGLAQATVKAFARSIAGLRATCIIGVFPL